MLAMPSEIVLLLSYLLMMLYLDTTCNNLLILQNAITSLHSWASEWQLETSYSKFQVLLLGAQHHHADYHLGSLVLSTNWFAKDFGFVLDWKIKFKSLYTDLYVWAIQRSALILRSLPLMISTYSRVRLFYLVT